MSWKINLDQIPQIITIIVFVTGVLYFPVNAKFDSIRKEIGIIKKDHITHCSYQKEQMKDFALLGETNLKLDQICIELRRLFDELDKCQTQDEKLRETIQVLILKLSTK